MSFNMMKALDKHGVIRTTYNTKQLKQHCIYLQLIISIADNLNYIYFSLFLIHFKYKLKLFSELPYIPMKLMKKIWYK